MTRALLLAAALGAALWAQPPKQQPPEAEPPEEDESLKPVDYSFNPLQATKEFNVGNFYFKKGNHKAAAARYEEATRWNPTFAEAYLKWADALVKLKERDRAREVWAKFLDVAPDHRRAPEIRKLLGR